MSANRSSGAIPFALRAAIGLGLLPPSAATLFGSDNAAVVRMPTQALARAAAEFRMGRHAEARRIWRVLARCGHAEAWYRLGLLAEGGLGEARDPGEARRRYENGARAGSRPAALRLGMLLQTGRLGVTDPAGARRWLKAAADAGEGSSAEQLDALRALARAARPVRSVRLLSTARSNVLAGRLPRIDGA
ncbi:MAG: sel1 repeat family protein [Gammaproteobacteria bacterium]|nr:sel1 repeat family protein [Gammaproteobacteria bacterium]MBU0771948.1 sel1 repeat family protein [Gammaproteobacteria bacterium]MBU0855475.1 sel1 repeat family protein [Gammaproteobacteria bacterium]MBU1845709.1 sel1 repeat family protein [Gammaproteobacteria bacterium]